ncbi:MAG: pantothenate kinase [Legionellales bacterium RIFCSPHIGHO2_12_FULL_42_9]|nr:MAG: pantothenate kinase [Legionellales bacterium RIFCSPHIGHO2_12_FULL_42_9]
MLLCIDVGNSHVYGGVCHGDQIKLRFRSTSNNSTSDEIGIFLKTVLRENNYSPEAIKQIAICSVVPKLDYSLRSACIKYFSIEPFYVQSHVKTGLHLQYHNQSEIGADRIANAIAAKQFYPTKDIIVIDFGTATTFCAINADHCYLGGVILPGVRLSADALSNNTAKLPSVEIIKPERIIGKSTVTGIQSGIFYGIIGACKEIIQQIIIQEFSITTPLVIATGGFAPLFDKQNIYDVLLPDLVLHGIRLAFYMNKY